MSGEKEITLRESRNATPRVKTPPKSSAIPVPFVYNPSDDGTYENLLILLHGLGEPNLDVCAHITTSTACRGHAGSVRQAGTTAASASDSNARTACSRAVRLPVNHDRVASSTRVYPESPSSTSKRTSGTPPSTHSATSSNTQTPPPRSSSWTKSSAISPPTADGLHMVSTSLASRRVGASRPSLRSSTGIRGSRSLRPHHRTPLRNQARARQAAAAPSDLSSAYAAPFYPTQHHCSRLQPPS